MLYYSLLDCNDTSVVSLARHCVLCKFVSKDVFVVFVEYMNLSDVFSHE